MIRKRGLGARIVLYTGLFSNSSDPYKGFGGSYIFNIFLQVLLVIIPTPYYFCLACSFLSDRCDLSAAFTFTGALWVHTLFLDFNWDSGFRVQGLGYSSCPRSTL